MSNRRFKIAFLKKLIVPILCSYLLFQVCSCLNSSPSQGESATSVGRKSKNLFPFVWVTFQPSPCGSNNEGVCVQRGKCGKRGGTVSGTCQDGFGECCTFEVMCNASRTTVDVNQLVTTLKSPTPTDTPCTFRFKKEPNICQIRLDFEDYESAKADPDGMCLTEKLRIMNSITVESPFITCGNLKDQHMYLTFGAQDTIDIVPVLKMGSSKYKIIATRIPCDSKNRAPDYCLQYFTKSEDTVKSFDFGGQQQDNQKYTICVKPTASSDMIMWKPCTGVTTTNPFNIITNIQVGPITCTTDWVQVKGDDKRCEAFPTVTSKWKPYEVMVNFDEMEFPPPPPSFNIPLNPATADCAGDCTALSVPGAYDCACTDPMAMNFTCTCIVTQVSPVPIQTDFDNTGFCLQYSQ